MNWNRIAFGILCEYRGLTRAAVARRLKISSQHLANCIGECDNKHWQRALKVLEFNQQRWNMLLSGLRQVLPC